MGDVVEIALKYKSKGYKVACAAIPDSLPCFESNLSLPLLLVIGGEKRGISRKILDLADVNVRIEYGRDFMGSLPSVSAISVMAFEIARKKGKLR
jgi:23S rRNA (guanosine2251-2'-O)-methyltransferase